MMKDDDIYYQAVLARDPRFDGVFFIGVKTTGIYCRPICPAQPKRKNMVFYPDADTAEAAGYRPCLRCRPESAPQSAAWLGTSAVVKRALNIIYSGQYTNDDDESFANRFGLSARHLRRLFQEEIGQTPKQVMDRQRLNFARQLIIESAMSLTQIAYLSGFGSVRRFNDAIKTRFTRTPSQLRKNQAGKSHAKQEVSLYLSYRPPFPWQQILLPFKNHEITGLEKITTDSYERIITSNGQLAYMTVHNDAKRHRLKLSVNASDFSQLYWIIQRVRQMFDLNSDPLVIQKLMHKQPVLKKLHQQFPGLRIPTGWDSFEIAISTILGQLVSIKRANQLCQQLLQHYGDKVKHPISKETVYLFPSPEQILHASLDQLGTTKMRKQALKNFCRALLEQKISLEPHQQYDTFIANCLAIKGIGPWTAEYIALRALGITDAFPHEDLIIKRLTDKHRTIKTDTFKPWRGYLTMYLWKLHQQQAQSC